MLKSLTSPKLLAAEFEVHSSTKQLMKQFSSQTKQSKLTTQSYSENPILECNYPLRVSVLVNEDIRRHLSMPNSERKSKLNLPKNIYPDHLSTQYIRKLIEKQLTALTDMPYVLRYQFPDTMDIPKTLHDEDILSIYQLSESTGRSFLYIIDPSPPMNFPPPSPEKPYLINLPDPLESPTYTMVSFYTFYDIIDPAGVIAQLEEVWKPFRVVGRVYVANEGINAQMAIPSNIIEQFRYATIQNIDCFKDHLYLNIDHSLTAEEFNIAKPFRSLHIRMREQIVSDGFPLVNTSTSIPTNPLRIDWKQGGREMPPLEWHQNLDNPKAIILDCRNSYESDVGRFENAIPLQTTFFRESWNVLEEKLANVPKDTPIMTYCTGGIRCVKINAYLEQKLGFTNASRLQGGIISYTKQIEKLRDTNQSNTFISDKINGSLPHHLRHVPESKFKGTNYVFDERMGARITADILTACETCGQLCDMFCNCNNPSCHVRFIQCDNCRTSYSGCCSQYCKKTHLDRASSEEKRIQSELETLREKRILQYSSSTPNRTLLSRRQASRLVQSNYTPPPKPDYSSSNVKENIQVLHHTSSSDAFLDALHSYCEKYSTAETNVLRQLREETEAIYPPNVSRMISGGLQGNILSMLASATNAQAVLDLGTFTGYSAISFAQGVSTNNPPGHVYTCDSDPECLAIASKYINLSDLNNIIELRNLSAYDMIKEARDRELIFDIVFIDADKKQYLNYLLDIIGYEARVSTNSEEYVKVKTSLIRHNSFIIIDNTLWKGLVLNQDDELKDHAPNAENYGKGSRMLALAQAMHNFNKKVVDQPSLSEMFDTVILPLRDGLTVLRYKG